MIAEVRLWSRTIGAVSMDVTTIDVTDHHWQYTLGIYRTQGKKTFLQVQVRPAKILKSDLLLSKISQAQVLKC